MTISRFKDRSTWSAEEEFQFMRSGRMPESEEWLEARHEVLELHGIEDDRAEATTDKSEMSTQQHLDRLSKS